MFVFAVNLELRIAQDPLFDAKSLNFLYIKGHQQIDHGRMVF